MGSYKKVTNNTTKPKKFIYAEDDVYAGVCADSIQHRLYHTTLDPDEKFKQKQIGLLAEKPPRQYIDEKMRYGANNDKIKYKLIKEEVKDWIEDEYGFTFTDKPSPWAPKKLGEKREREKEVESDDERPASKKRIDSSDEELPKTKKLDTSAPIIGQSEVTDIFKNFENMFKRLDQQEILLNEIATRGRQADSLTTPRE
jgi:hypothetical protein